jgi:hypothetical protein
MKRLGYRRLFGLEKGAQLFGGREPVKIDRAFRVFAGELVTIEAGDEMQRRFTAISDGKRNSGGQ